MRTDRSPRLRNFKASLCRPQPASLLLPSSPRNCFSNFCNGVKRPTQPKHPNNGTDESPEGTDKLRLARRNMTEKFAPAQIFVRRHTASKICDVVVLVRSQEMVLRCSDYSQALKWARLECKSYNISEAKIEPLGGYEQDDVPLFTLPKQL